MTEYDLTIRVLIPLLQACGFSKTEYKGGPTELGQDIVCSGVDRFGQPDILVAQVKMYKPSARAKDKRSLAEIVTQLSQAAETPVPTLDGHGRYLSRICLITPHPVEISALRTRFRGYEALRRRNIDRFDGPRICDLLKAKLPDL